MYVHMCPCVECDVQIGNRSSSYTVESSVRRDGSYIYEEFLATDGVDVKVYTVGPDYAHAEARKCPVSHTCMTHTWRICMRGTMGIH